MEKIRILCTADLHLGRSSACMEAHPGLDGSGVGAWKRIVRMAIAQGASAVAIAGDVFDSLGSFYETRQAFREGVLSLKNHGIPVVAVAGNHDWEALPRYQRQFPDENFVFLGAKGEWQTQVVPTPQGEVAFVGWSFPSEHFTERGFDRLPGASTSGPTVGLVHGDLLPGSKYHPLSVSDFDRGADAWVVGHIHLLQEVGSQAVYPGSPQAFDFGPGERGLHGVRWLTFEEGRPTFSGIEPISSVRFEQVELAVELAEEDTPWEAAMREAELLIGRYRKESPHLDSIQLRASVEFSGCSGKMSPGEKPEITGDGRDAIQFTSVRWRPRIDPWDLARSSDAAGEMARLLIGAKGFGDGERIPDPLWVSRAQSLIEEGARDVLRVYRATICKADDEGEFARPEPTELESFAISRSALMAELENLLATSVAAQEVMS